MREGQLTGNTQTRSSDREKGGLGPELVDQLRVVCGQNDKLATHEIVLFCCRVHVGMQARERQAMSTIHTHTDTHRQSEGRQVS